MKIRTKLREAHKSSADSSSVSSIVWSSNGNHIVTASSSDNSICIHDAVSPANPPKTLLNHREGVTALAMSPNSTCLASGSVDHSVKLYKFPSGDFESNITRFTLPIRALAFNKSGTILAAAGDDEGIKLVNTIDGTIARVLKGHKGPITSVDFDPKSEYLASLDSFGTVIFWELQTGNTIHVLNDVAPNNGSSGSARNIIAWSPDGEMLAVPGLRNDVVMYDRDTAEKLFALRGDHIQRICFLSWSPNGKYMATSGLDRQILVWDVAKKQDIDRQKFTECISCMAWKPQGNALAVIDVMGKYGVWESAVPSTMKSPTEDMPSLYSRTGNGFSLFDMEDEPSASGSLSDMNEDILDDVELSSRKRPRKQPKYEEDWEVDIENELEDIPKVEPRKKAFHGRKDSTNSHNGLRTMVSGPKMQESFQPGATPVQLGKRHFLCYNMVGSITTMQHEGYSHIETDFHDTSSGPRVPAMSDYFGFTMACLNENGSVFANPCKGEKNMSTLMYRPFKSWANNSEWSMRFEGEEVRAIALGNNWVAAVTSLNFLRIYTVAGLQKNIVSLNGSVVTAVGHKDELAVVTHTSPSLPTDEQMLEFELFNVLQGTQLLRGRLPLTPGSCLIWFGFSEEGQLSSFDSKGFLRVYSNQLGGKWLPLFSASKVKKPEETYWVTGLNKNKLFCIVCNAPETFPQPASKPVLTLLDLSFPLPSSDLGADSLENEFIMCNMHLSQIQKTIEEKAAAGHDTSSLDDEAFNLEISLDRCIVKLIASCCNGDKLERATELVKLLSLEKSVRAAIKLVTNLKLTNLAERFNDILEERLLNKKRNTVLPRSNSTYDATGNGMVLGHNSSNSDVTGKADDTSKADVLSHKLSAIQEMSNTPHSLAVPFFKRKQNAREPAKNGNLKTEQNHSSGTAEKVTEVMSAGKLEDTKEENIGETKTVKGPSNPFAKSSSNQAASTSSNPFAKSSSNQVVSRPSNPFAKSPSNQAASKSFFDSLKKKSSTNGS